VSPALAFLGISILGTWGLASIGLIAGGIIMLFFPGDPTTASDNTLGGIVFIVAGRWILQAVDDEPRAWAPSDLAAPV